MKLAKEVAAKEVAAKGAAKGIPKMAREVEWERDVVAGTAAETKKLNVTWMYKSSDHLMLQEKALIHLMKTSKFSQKT